ncbi:MAG: restriction endonuclease subunit S [Roseburia sp.]|nr:restriction endonuclease subunit S [Roseburia sp.]
MSDTLVKIANIAKVITKGTTPTTLGYEFQDIGVNFLKIECFDENGCFIADKVTHISEECNDKLKRSQLECGDVLFSIAGAIGRVAIVTEEMLPANTNQALAIIRIHDENVHLPYIKLILTSNIVKEQIERKKQGVAQLNLSLKDVGDIEIPMPKLEKQKKIVELFGKIQNIISNRNQELNNLDNLIKARFVELFGSEENKIPIREMCNVTGGYSFKSGDISNDGAIKILQIGNVYLDNVSWETTNYLPEGFDEKYSKFMLNEGDIVIALTRPMIQSLGNVKACIVKPSDLPCLLNQRVGRIVAKKEKSVFLEFIYGCLMTDDFTRYVETCSIGCSQPNISTKDIENYLIPNATYERQEAYVEFKKQTDKSKFKEIATTNIYIVLIT